MTNTLQTLIGKTVNKDVAERELEKLAKKEGYTKCQLREPGGFYDCQFDTSRLQVHIDNTNKIVDIKEG
jgi:chloramphenicol 3-O-phosphotransferase